MTRLCCSFASAVQILKLGKHHKRYVVLGESTLVQYWANQRGFHAKVLGFIAFACSMSRSFNWFTWVAAPRSAVTSNRPRPASHAPRRRKHNLQLCSLAVSWPAKSAVKAVVQP
jgi:hypothetical protein